jgi:hypothetical protein
MEHSNKAAFQVAAIPQCVAKHMNQIEQQPGYICTRITTWTAPLCRAGLLDRRITHPGRQLVKTGCPPEQNAYPLGRVAFVPQPPQLLASLIVSTSQPFAGMLSQLANLQWESKKAALPESLIAKSASQRAEDAGFRVRADETAMV